MIKNCPFCQLPLSLNEVFGSYFQCSKCIKTNWSGNSRVMIYINENSETSMMILSTDKYHIVNVIDRSFSPLNANYDTKIFDWRTHKEYSFYGLVDWNLEHTTMQKVDIKAEQVIKSYKLFG